MRIVSMAVNVPGPVAVARLVAGGAHAIKVEPPWGDPLEQLCKPWYDELHIGVEVRRVDLKSTAGATEMRQWLADADIFVASHRPSALGRLGLDAQTLHRTLPTLRHLNIVGDTATPEEAGHDLTYQARAGLVADAMPSTLIADMAGAERALAAIAVAMQTSGTSSVVGLFDTLNDMAAPMRYGLTTKGGPLNGGNPAYGIYQTRHGTVAVGALEPHFRSRFYDGLGLPDGADPTAVLMTKTAAEWETWAAARDIPLVECRMRK